MTRNVERDAAIRQLVPINRLPPENFDALVAAAEFENVRERQVVYVQGHRDDFVHYLIDGEVELLWNGKPVKRLPADSKAAKRPLDRPGRKRYTLRAKTNCTILRFPREDFDRQLMQGHLYADPHQVEVSEIAGEKSSNWMIRMLQSELFTRLPAINIQKIFGRMERISVAADEVVVRQGEPGDYYYVIERGYCEVSRKIPGGKEIHLADLGAGEAFGEAAIIAGDVRNASVTMLSSGTLMRLSCADFNELIRAPLLHGLDADAALAAIADGAIWIDIRFREEHARTPLAHALNLPFNVLRLQAGRLDQSRKYIVCCDDATQSAVGAYLLIERGVSVDYLDGAISALVQQHSALLVPAMPEQEHERPRVVEFPGAASAAAEERDEHSTEDSAMEDERTGSINLENTIEKIDRLYTQKEWEAETDAARRVPVDKYAHTVTGQHLADLIDEIHANQGPALDTGGRSSASGASLGEDGLFDVAPETGGLSDTQGTSVLLVDTRAPLPATSSEILDDDELFAGDDSLARIVQDFEYRIRDYVEAASYKRLAEVEGRYQDKLARIRKAAAREVHKRQLESRQRYEQHYKKKELQLRAHYKKLMALANKISEQKAQLQRAKQQFEEKLTAANAVYKQVEDMRRTLREHISNVPDDDRDGNGSRESA